MIIPPSGQTYSNPALPPQREDRFYSNTGRLSGPEELRSFTMPSLDKATGPMSLEMESKRNVSKHNLGNLNVFATCLPTKSDVTRAGFVPPIRI